MRAGSETSEESLGSVLKVWTGILVAYRCMVKGVLGGQLWSFGALLSGLFVVSIEAAVNVKTRGSTASL